MGDRRQRLDRARLYLVCDARPDSFLHAALRGGVEIVQLRIKEGSDERILYEARRFARVCAEYGALFILNDRPDLVTHAGADGVHLGQDDMPVARARELVGAERLIGLSTHTPAQIDSVGGTRGESVGGTRIDSVGGTRGDSVGGTPIGATGEEQIDETGDEERAVAVDYIGVGPVHRTPTKPGRAPVGLELVRYAATHARVPWFAIGGIDAGNAHSVVGAGARRIAVVRALTRAADPQMAARTLRQVLNTPGGLGAAAA